MPKTDEYNAGKITGIRVSNTTISVAKKNYVRNFLGIFQITHLKKLFLQAN